jgi:hypothetical protein
MEAYNDQVIPFPFHYEIVSDYSPLLDPPLKTALENPLSLQPSMQITFHILLEDGKGHL